MPRIVIDTNIYLSAMIAGGKPEEILDLAREKQIQLFISEPIKTEIADVLKRKFYWQDSRIQTALRDIDENTTLVYPSKQENIIKKHSADNRILECALAAGAHFIISGDKKHILPLKKFRGIKILKASEFLEFFKRYVR